jgi:PrgI family protein
MRTAVKVPIHMNMPDKVVFGLTARQLLILLIGCSAGYDLYLQLHVLSVYVVAGMIVRIAIASIPVVIALVLALLSIEGRPLEIWLFVLIRYWQHPQLYVWRSLRQSVETQVEGRHPHLEASMRASRDDADELER